MTDTSQIDLPSTSRTPYRVAAVSFFNTRPLTYSLESEQRVDICFDVPSKLAQKLQSGQADCALLPSIDYQKTTSKWSILPIAAIASQGEVLTVRIMSKLPLDQIQYLACDPDSHTSVALAGVIWQLRFGRELPIKPLTLPAESHQAVLLIGDKVLPELPNWPYQLDLGQAWFEHTSLPFVYAFWTCSNESPQQELYHLLANAAADGHRNLDSIIEKYAQQHGFNHELAKRYLTEHICFEFGKRQQRGLCRFYELAQQFGLLENCRPLRFYNPLEEDSAAESKV